MMVLFTYIFFAELIGRS